MTDFSRREFGALVAGGVAAGRAGPAQALTANDVVERIVKNVGVDWRLASIDGIKTGESSTVVTGIATTAMATLVVLQQAVKAGANFVVTCEPTFYGRAETRTQPTPGRVGGGFIAPPPPDLVLAAKNDLIDQNKLVIFRLCDHWRSRTPNPFASGLARVLGWTTYQDAGDPLRFTVPTLTLDVLASQLKKALNARGGIRVVGDPSTSVQRVAWLPGPTPIQAALQTLPNVDVIVAGEVREWESVEYARDTVHSARRKGLILVGRVVSEEPGMDACADWLRTVVPEVPVRHLPAGDPYWRPA
jgi:putative NIF3 family GTP cyclohydrolase 1 type 2